jgi:hypothetical protein
MIVAFISTSKKMRSNFVPHYFRIEDVLGTELLSWARGEAGSKICHTIGVATSDKNEFETARFRGRWNSTNSIVI